MTTTIPGLVGELPTQPEKLIGWISENVSFFSRTRWSL